MYGDAVVARLEDTNEIVRRAALETLGQLDPASLAQHADAVLAMPEDSEWCVRKAALHTLGERVARGGLQPMWTARRGCRGAGDSAASWAGPPRSDARMCNARTAAGLNGASPAPPPGHGASSVLVQSRNRSGVVE